MKRLVVVGGGAAGIFGAIICREAGFLGEILVVEKNKKLLSKVKISGGGRCNVTHGCTEVQKLIQNYPRGSKELRSVFSRFGPKDMMAWLEERGVPLKTEEDGRVFPESNDSQSIIDCFLQTAEKASIKIQTEKEVESAQIQENGDFELLLSGGETLKAEKIFIATGGSPKEKSYQWLRDLGHSIIPPVPSLFTFNIPGHPLKYLPGISVPHAWIKITGTRLSEEGALLVTHWGFSGPAILRLSAWGARELYEKNYDFSIEINWLGKRKEEELQEEFSVIKKTEGKKNLAHSPFSLSKRLWFYLLERASLSREKRWADVSREDLKRLSSCLLRDTYSVLGKTTFKEEFVTCGGVSLKEVDFKTMESKVVKGLYFAGEILDIDGITGGFNFQSAWSTAWIAGKALANS